MFRKRTAKKGQIRRVEEGQVSENKNLLGVEKPNRQPLSTDIEEIQRKIQFKWDSAHQNDETEEGNEKLEDWISIVSHKSNRRFTAQDNILNNYELELDSEEPCPSRERSPSFKKNRSHFEKKNYDTLESRNPNIKSTLRIDYQHDICKDFKETGYCGFGDTCKFLHDRSDFTSGWKLDLEWEKEQKRKRFGMEPHPRTNQENSEIQSFPRKCSICKRRWTPGSNPVFTLCNHYFCEKCALNHYISTSKCFVCNLPTKGTFNCAQNLQLEENGEGELTEEESEQETEPEKSEETPN
ncbi:Zinc finger CCCH domain-containing protein 1 [Cryptosporidium felis]|nr:Zinc finger CCCH domain-containing protein 1 [Cryptosporidium felis]